VLGSGTAFYVDAEGNALTNAHVIEGCRSVSLGGAPAEVLAVSRQNDLAVLAPSSPAGTYPYLAFASSPAALNSDVTVAGFPLQPILGGLNVTRGSVSSLSGLQGDITTMQITAPIQPGNSGGPVVNRDGQVVGVVVAKIALEAALQRFGSVPENVNFAIRSDIAKLFLTANGIGFEEANSPRDLSPEDLADELQHATVLVECFQ
jgi:S1-C subfamily serine protease